MMGPFQGGNNTHVGVVGSETGGVILDLMTASFQSEINPEQLPKKSQNARRGPCVIAPCIGAVVICT